MFGGGSGGLGGLGTGDGGGVALKAVAIVCESLSQWA
jgi:hypothetical protein